MASFKLNSYICLVKNPGKRGNDERPRKEKGPTLCITLFSATVHSDSTLIKNTQRELFHTGPTMAALHSPEIGAARGQDHLVTGELCVLHQQHYISQ